jgi:methyl-accepting chemotaxis protein
MMRKQAILYIFFFISVFPLTAAWAYTTTPRISDREIIRSLTELKAGQKALNQRIDDLNHRIDDLNLRINDLDKKLDQRINDLDKKLDQRINDLDKKLSQRIDDLNQRIDDLIWFGGVMGGGIFMLITALFGYIVWDRKTMMKPMQEKLENLEHEKLRHLEQVVDQHIGLQQNKGLLHNIHAALKDIAKHDPAVAEALKAHSL